MIDVYLATGRDSKVECRAAAILHTDRSERIEVRLSGTGEAFLHPDSSHSGQGAGEFHFIVAGAAERD